MDVRLVDVQMVHQLQDISPEMFTVARGLGGFVTGSVSPDVDGDHPVVLRQGLGDAIGKPVALRTARVSVNQDHRSAAPLHHVMDLHTIRCHEVPVGGIGGCDRGKHQRQSRDGVVSPVHLRNSSVTEPCPSRAQPGGILARAVEGC